ncbi:hypothetical protein EDB81DRAFT_857530 [Dactylonectria macrodidyma]|uniref:Uncharacterized protein n=1 Tax=Dactylonectria macrodidyma TaxID=307937 RepID=A0A9P9EQD1_9HYPO|nr:hypothetical protein EDB81DRAFT_857530 [Dactylonectria macrodidyma]
MTSNTLKVALLLAILHPVSGYDPLADFLLAKAELGGTPWNVNETVWPAIMANPDIEKTYPILGYNTTMPFPGEEIDGWTITVSVQKSKPAKGNIETDNPDGVFALSLYRLNPPEALVKEQIESNGSYVPHSSWGFAYGFERIKGDRLAKLNDDDGSCTKMLDDDCLEQLSLGGKYEGCLEPVEEVAGTGNKMMNMTDMASVIGKKAAANVDWYSGSEILSAASNVTDSANATSVELIGNLAHILVVFWINWDDFKVGNTTEPIGQTLLCPRTVNYTAALYETSAASGPLTFFFLAALLPLATVSHNGFLCHVKYSRVERAANKFYSLLK